MSLESVRISCCGRHCGDYESMREGSKKLRYNRDSWWIGLGNVRLFHCTGASRIKQGRITDIHPIVARS